MTDLVGQFDQQVATPPQEDPLVVIRKQELALKGQELQQDKEQFQMKEQMRAQEQSRQDKIDRERIDAQRDIAKMKDDTTQDRLDQQKELKLIDLGLNQIDQYR
jgi:hypothetical protein